MILPPCHCSFRPWSCTVVLPSAYAIDERAGEIFVVDDGRALRRCHLEDGSMLREGERFRATRLGNVRHHQHQRRAAANAHLLAALAGRSADGHLGTARLAAGSRLARPDHRSAQHQLVRYVPAPHLVRLHFPARLHQLLHGVVSGGAYTLHSVFHTTIGKKTASHHAATTHASLLSVCKLDDGGRRAADLPA